MSLLGLVRHIAEVERGWFRRRFTGRHTGAPPEPGRSGADFDAAVAEMAVVDEALAA
jgi:hypothetical protein